MDIYSLWGSVDHHVPFWIESLNWFSATLHYQYEKLSLLVPEKFDLYCSIFGCLDGWMSG